jgi:hypothetical protein
MPKLQARNRHLHAISFKFRPFLLDTPRAAVQYIERHNGAVILLLPVHRPHIFTEQQFVLSLALGLYFQP